MDSILDTIKKLLGLTNDYDAFDEDVIVGINGAISTLAQLGVAALDGFMITGQDETWDDVQGLINVSSLPLIKQYVYLKTKKIFDPPSSGTASSAMNELISELEFRIKVNEDQ